MTNFSLKQLPKKWLTKKKKEKDKDTQFEYLKKQKSFLGEIKSIFYGF